jgi:iron complex outermembrane recepter protein
MFCALPVNGALAEEAAETVESEPISLGEVTVQAEMLKDNIDLAPEGYTINLDEYKKAGVPHTLYDFMADRAIIDFRGISTLSPEVDEVTMRGFNTRQFVTTINGLAIQKTGGWWGGHFLDLRTIPLELIESIEILPGPHSALYEGRAIAGVINIKTRTPVRRDEPEVDYRVNASYATYNTHDSSLTATGGGGAMDYVLSVKKYETDGHLKNHAYDQSTMSSRLAWLLPNDGHFSLMGTYSEIYREIPSENDPNGNFYDKDYPVVLRDDVSGRWRDPAGNARRTKKPHTLMANWRQPSELGIWSIGLYHTHDNQKYENDAWDEPTMLTSWNSFGGNIQNEVLLADDHLVTFGFDTAVLRSRSSTDIVRTYAGFIQDEWSVTRRLTLRPGLRYEKLDIWWSNLRGGDYVIPGIEKDYAEKNYSGYMPKFFATYQLDDLAGFLRDTSVSMGVSRVWSPRTNCEVCTWGSGYEMDPVKGYGVDLILLRRLWEDINLMVNVNHYAFDNWVVSADGSTNYYKTSPWSRRMLGLEDVTKSGVEMEFNGNITDNLSMNIGFAYVDWEYDGPKGGVEEITAKSRLTNIAKYRINSGVTYNFTDRLQLHVDYKHQDKQENEVIDVIDEDAGLFEVRTVKIDSYGVLDVSASYIIVDRWNGIEKPTIKLFANNALDKDYVNTRGYPAPERMLGASLSVNF